MALILLWLGGLSFAGCIIWMWLFGFTFESGLVMVASVFVAAVAFRRMDRVRRLKSLDYLGQVYIVVSMGAFCGFVVLAILELEHVYGGSLWPLLPFICLGGALTYIARHRMKRAGQLFDLRWVGTLPRRAALQENIKCEGYEVVTGFSQYGASTSQRGRIFLEHEAQLPCVIRAEAGSASVYEIPAYKGWVAQGSTLLRESYFHNPFSVPKRTKPASHVEQALLQDLSKLIADLKVISKELKGGLIEVTPERTSVLLKKYELTPEELGSACQLLLRVEATLDNYLKGERGEIDKQSTV